MPARPSSTCAASLVATNTLHARDEHLARIDRWITGTLAQETTPTAGICCTTTPSGTCCADYGNEPPTARPRTSSTSCSASTCAAVGLLDWLAARQLTLATARQGDLDAWLASRDSTLHRETGHFLRWAKKNRHTTLDAPAVNRGGPFSVFDTETRWEQARWLLHDSTVKPEDRLAGLLVLLYAQWPASISRLTVDHIDINDNDFRIRLGEQPIVLPEPLAALTHQVIARRHGKAAIGDDEASPWLFPGGQPGRPISAYQLAQTTPPTRPAPRPSPLHRPVPTCHRPARRRPRPHARHPPSRRRRLATLRGPVRRN